MGSNSRNSFGARADLRAGGRSYEVFRLDALPGAARLPYSLKVLLENMLRHEDDLTVHAGDIESLAGWDADAEPSKEIAFAPARILLQDFTGVPAVVDLAAMRDAMVTLGGDAGRVNPLIPAELVIDHSVIADVYGTRDAFARNAELEFQRNEERYRFLRWGQGAFETLRVVPPDTGICHQVNLEYLARVVFDTDDGQAYPDTLLGTDSHTTMINGLGVLGWGVGGIEAEAAMLGQPVSMLIPKVVGFQLTGSLPDGSTATDLVLTVTEMLRHHGVVGKFVEFYGEGVAKVPLANRATIGNMSPEYGSTCAIFPIDEETLRYLALTGRSAERIELVEAYAKEQGLWHDPTHQPDYSERLSLDLSTVVPSLAGPARPQDRVPLDQARSGYRSAVVKMLGKGTADAPPTNPTPVTLDDGTSFDLDHGQVVIAAITSCTNTSNPSVMIAAGLLARNAVERGLTTKPWVKTSLAPGSKVVMDYYERAGLVPYLEKLGFDLVGFGCTTCIGNSGPLLGPISDAVSAGDLVVVSVLSGNRNFEGRISPDCRMNYLASPPLVVAYALAGSIDLDLVNSPLGTGPDGSPVYLRDIWPSPAEVAAVIESSVESKMFTSSYDSVYDGDQRWQGLPVPTGDAYAWDNTSTYVRKPPYFDGITMTPPPLPRRTRRPRARSARRQRHHRPHLAGGQHPQGRARGKLAGRRGSGSERVQLLRGPARQSRGHDPGHLCQHPFAQPPRARHGGRGHPPPPGRAGDVHLRRGQALRTGGRAAPHPGRQGVRVGLLTGLGRQRDGSARGASRVGRELRADPPQQPRRHGRPASAVQGGG